MSGLVEVARFDTPLRAELARMFVESYGLNALVFDGNLYNNSEGALIGVRLMVPEDEADEAREALRDYPPRAGARSESDRRRHSSGAP